MEVKNVFYNIIAAISQISKKPVMEKKQLMHRIQHVTMVWKTVT